MSNSKTAEVQNPKGISIPKNEIVIVSGSSGLIGTSIINELSKRYQVIGLDNVGYPFPPIEAECVCIDINSDESMERAFARIRYAYGNRIASVIHLAAYYSFSEKESPLYDKITVQGTRRLLKYLQDFEVEQFLFTSSMLVYKPSKPGQKITEDWPLEAQWGYPQSKVSTEKILHEERGPIPVLSMRVAGVYSDEGNSIPITNQIRRIYEKQLTSYFFPGDASHGSTFIHLDDLIAVMVKAVDKRKELPPDLILNIGEEETLSNADLQRIISTEIRGTEQKMFRIPKFLARIGAALQNLFGNHFIKPWMIDLADDHLEMDSSRAGRMLDWKPRHSLGNTLPKMIAKLKAGPEKFYKENDLKK